MEGIALNKKEANTLNNQITLLLNPLADFNSSKYCKPLELKSGLFLVLKPTNKEWLNMLDIKWEKFNVSNLLISDII